MSAKRKQLTTKPTATAAADSDSDLSEVTTTRKKVKSTPQVILYKSATATAGDSDNKSSIPKFGSVKSVPAPKKATDALTPFQKRVYAMCKRVPKGRVTTYGALAAAVGGGARAVGTALKGNPFAPIVPCHRVVRGDLSLGGFAGATNPLSDLIAKKIALLRSEGVVIVASKSNTEMRIKDSTFVDPMTAVKLTSGELNPTELARPTEDSLAEHLKADRAASAAAAALDD